MYVDFCFLPPPIRLSSSSLKSSGTSMISNSSLTPCTRTPHLLISSAMVEEYLEHFSTRLSTALSIISRSSVALKKSSTCWFKADSSLSSVSSTSESSVKSSLSLAAAASSASCFSSSSSESTTISSGSSSSTISGVSDFEPLINFLFLIGSSGINSGVSSLGSSLKAEYF
ncbi:hypothetical protein WICPIJ_005623 [Wickerhamomyces pijperi]|uniref:Uncharacterized protein n=1 Tax=Wickerhamomyces pijperi TaxID=599730 RepID=A0A9P8TLR8_WICPI|nr:hypothetical protein WICPIJ_005623 [Wickerhamomyces pijperi]